MPNLIGCLHSKRIINPYTKELQYVPCGKCNACLQSRAMKWTKRLQVEAQAWKYVFFITLTYNDFHLPKIDLMSIDANEMDEDLQAACVACAPYINACDGKVNTFSVRDIQLFLKRLRKKIYENETVETHRVLRYYISGEFGPTTLRSHYHGILFSNSEWLSENLSKAISEAWSDYNRKTNTFYPYGRTDAQRVSSTACQYVASYCNFFAHLPQILQHKWFRPFSLFSRCPPIGSNTFSNAQVSTIFYNALPRFSYTSPDNGKVVNVRLWRFIENNLFPKCKGFDKLSHIERIALYGVYTNKAFHGDFETFVTHLTFMQSDLRNCNKVTDDVPIITLPLSRTMEIVLDNYVDRVTFGKSGTDFFNRESLYKLWLLSRRVANNCNYFNVSLHEHVSLIERYYHNTALDNLSMQFTAENDYLSKIPKLDKSHLPYLIDPAFVGNDRNLSMEDYNYYKLHFGVRNPLIDIMDSPYYSDIYQHLDIEYTNNHKIRVKNEYLQRNPSLKKIQDSLSQCRMVSPDKFKPSLYVSDPPIYENPDKVFNSPSEVPTADFHLFGKYLFDSKLL